jgi:non-ribosomal peptide synthetase component E (peptide arylation enzyme)
VLDGVTPFPADVAARYRELGYWEGRPLFDGFTTALAAYADRVAVVDEAGPVTYRQLGERSEHLARILLDLGLRPVDRVVVQLPNTAVFAYLYFALLRIGAAPVLALPGHRGYFRSPEHNARAFTPDGFYRSGDLLRKLPSGNYVVEGRVKDLINRGGEKISTEEVENLILAHEAVLNVACVPYPDPVLGERMCACVVPRPGVSSPSLDELVTFLRGFEIATFKLPERLEVFDTLPLSGFGKVSKKDLAARLAQGAA